MLTLILPLLAAPAAPAFTPAFAPALAPEHAAVAVVPQDEEEFPDKRPEVKQWIADFEDLVDDEQDDEAIALMDTLLAEFTRSGPKDREKIAEAFGECLEVKRKDLGEDQPDEKLQLAAATALGRMAPESVEEIVDRLDHKNIEDKPRAFRALILALGYTHHEDGVEPLQDLLRDHRAWVQAASAEALGQYTTADQKIRKDIVEWMLKVIMPVKNAVEANADDPVARERYDTIAQPFLTALQALTGHDARDFYDWQSWWNNNKKKDWDEGR